MDQAVVSGAGFITGVLLARFLGLSSYGVFAMSWLVVLFFGRIHIVTEKRERRKRRIPEYDVPATIAFCIIGCSDYVFVLQIFYGDVF